MPKPTALFATFLLALAGSNVMQAWSQFYTYLFTDQLPDTTFFAVVFWLWFATALVALCCGLWGGNRLLQTGDLKSGALTYFALISGFVVAPNGYELGYSSLRVGVNITFWSLGLGINVLGFAFLGWLIWLRGDDTTPSLEAAASPGRGAV